jgi:hypothetical protein
MQTSETASSGHKEARPHRQHHRGTYTKVVNASKHPIRELRKRNDRFYARLTVEDEQTGEKVVKWVPLPKAGTPSQAVEQLHGLKTERAENRLRPIGLTPTFAEYLAIHDARLEHPGKKPRTLITEQSHFVKWKKALGHLRLSCGSANVCPDGHQPGKRKLKSTPLRKGRKGKPSKLSNLASSCFSKINLTTSVQPCLVAESLSRRL